MELSKKAIYIIAAALFLFGAVLGAITGVFFIKGEPVITNVIGRDTLEVERLVTRTDTVIKTIERRPLKIDTIWLTDRDTIFVPVPISKSHFSGKNYDIWATGYKTAIDSVRVSERVITQTVTVTQKAEIDNVLSISLDVGSLFYGQNKLPYTGIGTTWNKGRMETGVSFGFLYQDGAHFYFNTGWRWQFLQRKF